MVPPSPSHLCRGRPTELASSEGHTRGAANEGGRIPDPNRRSHATRTIAVARTHIHRQSPTSNTFGRRERIAAGRRFVPPRTGRSIHMVRLCATSNPKDPANPRFPAPTFHTSRSVSVLSAGAPRWLLVMNSTLPTIHAQIPHKRCCDRFGACPRTLAISLTCGALAKAISKHACIIAEEQESTSEPLFGLIGLLPFCCFEVRSPSFPEAHR